MESGKALFISLAHNFLILFSLVILSGCLNNVDSALTGKNTPAAGASELRPYLLERYRIKLYERLDALKWHMGKDPPLFKFNSKSKSGYRAQLSAHDEHPHSRLTMTLVDFPSPKQMNPVTLKFYSLGTPEEISLEAIFEQAP